MANVLLIQPKIGLLDNIKSAPGLPISLLSAVKLVFEDYRVKLIDQRLDHNWEKTLKQELIKNPLVVGATAMLGPQVKFAIEIGELVKENAPEVPVVIGGPCASVLPEQVLESGAFDIVLRGDGEINFLSLVRALERARKRKVFYKKVLKRIPGLYFEDQTGKTVYTGQPELVDFNKMPDVPYSLVDVYKYLPKRSGEPTIDMETSRGCPFACTFCYNPKFNLRRWRALRPEIVLERVKYVKKKYGIGGVWFVDDEFFIDLERAREIILGMKEIGIRWTIQGVTAKSILAMDDDYLRMLVESGCEQMNIGAESGSNRILKMVRKGIEKKDILVVNRKLKKFPIMPWYYFMIGFPTETKREREKTINLITRLLKDNPRAKISGIGCYTPYPGTELFEESQKYGYKAPERFIEWSTYAVDNINVPWVKGKAMREIQTIQFASFFVDQKARDVGGFWWMKLLAFFYRPIARFRFKHHFYGLPFDIFLGNLFKRQFAS